MREKIQEIIQEILVNSNKPIIDVVFNEGTKLREDIGLDSFNLAELTVHIEEEFGIDIFEDGIVNTVGEIYQRLETKGKK